MLQEYNLLINGVTLLISLSGLICEAQSPTNDEMHATISEYGRLYITNIHIHYRLLIMALSPNMKFTPGEADNILHKSEEEHQVKWALNYLNAARSTWKLENEDMFKKTMSSYVGVNKTIVPNFCKTMLQQSSARNWDTNIQKNITYGCEVLKKYSELKWGARKKLDLMTIRWLNGSDENGQSQHISDKGFNYHSKKEYLECAQSVMKIHRTKAEVDCRSTVGEFLKLQQVKDTPSSKTQAIQFDKINENFNKSLVELKRRVENLEINRINYLKFMNPMERVISVIDAMEEEVDHKYGVYM
uniref:Secretory glycoprotein k5 n=3 Tax=Schistosoma mansoni TaxID=6183 RepID=A0A5K4F9C9_SCHMA